MDCLFCKISAKEIPAKMVYEGDDVFAIEDINPQAPVHLLIIPRLHISTMNETDASHAGLLANSMAVAVELANKYNVHESGYRLVYNVNRGACQSVFHIHLHLLGGRILGWPPG